MFNCPVEHNLVSLAPPLQANTTAYNHFHPFLFFETKTEIASNGTCGPLFFCKIYVATVILINF